MSQLPDGREKDWRASLPFPAHWLYYIGVKVVLLLLVVGFALYWYGLL